MASARVFEPLESEQEQTVQTEALLAEDAPASSPFRAKPALIVIGIVGLLAVVGAALLKQAKPQPMSLRNMITADESCSESEYVAYNLANEVYPYAEGTFATSGSHWSDEQVACVKSACAPVLAKLKEGMTSEDWQGNTYKKYIKKCKSALPCAKKIKEAKSSEVEGCEDLVEKTLMEDFATCTDLDAASAC